MSCASERIYVPDEHSMTKRATLPSIPVSLYSKSSTSTAFSSTGCFLRASSYAGTPFTFFAEKAGGICSNRPTLSAASFSRIAASSAGAAVRPLGFPVRIVSIRRKTKPEARRVALPAPVVKLHQPRSSSEQQHQNARRQRIERAKMPNLPESREVPHRIDDIVGSFSPRLIDDERAVERRRLRLAWHEMSGRWSKLLVRNWNRT